MCTHFIETEQQAMSRTALERSVRALAPLLSEARRQRIADVVNSRTGSLAVLLENAWDEGNRNAVLRSMDAFGTHTLHCINYGKEGKATSSSGASEMRTDAGARNWIVRRDWSEVETCIRQLQREGFTIASTTPNSNKTLQDVDFSKRLVIAFGNEHIGVSEALLEASDVKFSIPMIGFVESVNLSVSVAVTLYQAFSQRLARLGNHGDLSESEKLQLTLHYYMQSLGVQLAQNVIDRYSNI